MKIYGNKDNKIDKIKKKDFDLQDKVHKEEDDKIKQTFFKFVIVVLFVIFALYKWTTVFDFLTKEKTSESGTKPSVEWFIKKK